MKCDASVMISVHATLLFSLLLNSVLRSFDYLKITCAMEKQHELLPYQKLLPEIASPFACKFPSLKLLCSGLRQGILSSQERHTSSGRIHDGRLVGREECLAYGVSGCDSSALHLPSSAGL